MRRSASFGAAWLKRLSLLEVASDLFVQKWLCLWMLPPLPKVADIDARFSSGINQDAPAALRTSACGFVVADPVPADGLPLRHRICTNA